MATNTRCLQCNKKTDIGPGNAVIHLYTRQTWFSWLEIICTKCGETSKMFFGPDQWYQELIQLGQLQVGYIAEEYPPEDMIKSFEEIYELTPIKEEWVSPRRLAETERLGRYVEFHNWLCERGLDGLLE